MVESRKGMGFAAAELSDERHDGRGVLGASRQSAQHHAHVLTQCTSKARAREKFGRIAVVVRPLVRSYLLKRNREFVWVEGSPLAHFSAGHRVFVPRFHVISFTASYSGPDSSSKPSCEG